MQRLSVADAQPAAGEDSAHAAGGPSTAVAAEPAAGAGRDGNGSNATESAAAAAPAVDVSFPDAVAVHCLLAGLHSVQDGELPIMTSDFQSKHMIPSLPEGRQLIQVSHHRKGSPRERAHVTAAVADTAEGSLQSGDCISVGRRTLTVDAIADSLKHYDCCAGATLDMKKTSFKKLAKLLSVHEKKGLLQQASPSFHCVADVLVTHHALQTHVLMVVHQRVLAMESLYTGTTSDG